MYLTKTLKSATLIRLDGSAADAAEFLRAGNADVYGSGINMLRPIVDLVPGSKVLGAFYFVTFAVAARPGLSPAAHQQLTQWVDESVRARAEGAGAGGGVRVAV